MIEVTNVHVYGIATALRHMRMPYESFEKQDSKMLPDGRVILGLNDAKLLKQLSASGPEHRDFIRKIHVHLEVKAPRYWWQEFDTYKHPVKNSSSTMHLITKRHLTREDFELDDLVEEELKLLDSNISYFNMLIDLYKDPETKTKYQKERVLLRIKRFLPEGYLQLRGIDFDYETALCMLEQRYNHRLPQWRAFCKLVLLKLPLFEDIASSTEKGMKAIEHYKLEELARNGKHEQSGNN